MASGPPGPEGVPEGVPEGAPEGGPELDAALLDVMTGWLEHVETCVELAELPRDAFEAEYFDDGEAVDPEVYESWRAHYTRAYLATVEQLHEAAETLVLDFDGEGGAMTPAEFLRLELLPLFRLPGEREA